MMQLTPGCAVSLYRSFCRWADGALVGQNAEWIFLIGFCPMLAIPLFGEWWSILSLIVGAGWVTFLVWRIWVIARTGYIGGDAADLRDIRVARKKPWKKRRKRDDGRPPMN